MTHPIWLTLPTVAGLAVGMMGLLTAQAQSAARQRALWRICFTTLSLIVLAEVSGTIAVIPRIFHPAAGPSAQTPVGNTFKNASWEVSMNSGTAEHVAKASLQDSATLSPSWQEALMAAILLIAGPMIFITLRLLATCGLWLAVRRHTSVPTATQEQVTRVAARLHVRGNLRVRSLPWLHGPVVYGLFRPVLALPSDFGIRFSSAQQEAILLHELAHIEGNDTLWAWVADGVMAFLWWHPLVWWARRRLHLATECAADEASLALDNGPGYLAESLTLLARQFAEDSQIGGLAMAGSHFRSELGRRVERLLNMKGQTWHPWGGGRAWRARLIGLATMLATFLATYATLIPRPLQAGSRVDAAQKSPLGLAWSLLAPSETEEPRRERMASSLPILTSTATPTLNPDSPETSNRQDAKSGASGEGENLRTRTYSLSRSFFRRFSPANVSLDVPLSREDSEHVPAGIRKALKAAGVNTDPPFALFVKPQKGLVMLRATQADMILIENSFRQLNSEFQVVLEAKLTEFAPDMFERLGLAKHVVHPQVNKVPDDSDDSDDSTGTVCGVLTSGQYRDLLKILGSKGGISILNAPTLITRAGRQAQLKAVELRNLVTGLRKASKTETREAQSEWPFTPVSLPFEFGPVVDVFPSILADEATLEIRAKVVAREFVGYDGEPGLWKKFRDFQNPDAEVFKPGSGDSLAYPTPILRERRVEGSGKLWDGQTLFLYSTGATISVPEGHPAGRGGPGTLRAISSMASRAMQEGQKSFLVLITPTLVDESGNRLYPEDQWLERRESVPAQ